MFAPSIRTRVPKVQAGGGGGGSTKGGWRPLAGGTGVSPGKIWISKVS